ncbi:MAG: hypothetical protein ABDI20_00765 [Candidatus Bipolaricaulaceae bacterium]
MWAFLLLGVVSLWAFGQTTLVLYSFGLAMVEETRRVHLAEEGLLELSGFPTDTLWETWEVEGLEVRFLRPVSQERALLRYRAPAPGERDVRFRYLARGFTWKIGYDAELQGDELRVVGKVLVLNETGRDFSGARIILVAGEMRAPHDLVLAPKAALVEATPAEAFEYYRYDLPGTWEVPQGSLVLPLVRTRAPAHKLYRFRGQGVEVRLRFTAPAVLPAGEVRLYAEGIYAGADTIGHTPQGREVELFVGRAFDLWGRRVKVHHERIEEDLFRETWRIVLRSAKAEDVVVEVVESLPGYWRILSSTAPHEVLDAQRVKFAVPVPKGGEAVLEYTVEWRP